MLLGSYIGVIIVLASLENRLVYPGAYDRSWSEPPPELEIENIFLPLDHNTLIHGWWTLTPDWSPDKGAILYSHGNGGNLSHRADLLNRWKNELGLPILIYDYPAYGKSTGQPTEQLCYSACDLAYRWLTEQQRVPPDRILLLGSSLGGAITIECATRHPCRMVICCSTFTSLQDMAKRQFPWLPVRWFMRHNMNSLERIDKINAPIYLVHGTADTLVPHQMSEQLHAVARDPKQLLLLPGHPHTHPDQPEFFNSLRQFLKECSPN